MPKRQPGPITAEQSRNKGGAAPAAHKIAGDKAAITGTATDQTGAIVTGAKAVLTGPAGEKLEVTVDAKGSYSFTWPQSR